MDSKELQGLLEAYTQVHTTQEVDEAVKGASPHTMEMRKGDAADRKKGIKPLSAKKGEEYAKYKMSQMAHSKRERMGEEVEVVDEARRADKEGYERGTPANPTNRNIPAGDPSQRSRLHSRIKSRADEMGRERRGSAAYRSGSRPPVSKKEKAFLRASDRTRQSVSNPPVPDTGRHADVSRYDREDSSNPKRNPKHNANKETAAESFDLFDYLLEYLVAEGYADTNKAALVIMANMSEEWRESIIESQYARENPEKYEREQAKAKSKKQKAMEDPHTGINSPAFEKFMRQQMGR